MAEERMAEPGWYVYTGAEITEILEQIEEVSTWRAEGDSCAMALADLRSVGDWLDPILRDTQGDVQFPIEVHNQIYFWNTVYPAVFAGLCDRLQYNDPAVREDTATQQTYQQQQQQQQQTQQQDVPPPPPPTQTSNFWADNKLLIIGGALVVGGIAIYLKSK